MSIAYDAGSSKTQNASTVTWSHTCTGSNLVLLVGGRVNGGTSACSYNGVALTKVMDQTLSGSDVTTLWYLLNPATGANTISITQTGSGAIFMAAVSYTGVKQTGFPDTSTNAAGSGNSMTATMTTTTNADWLVGVFDSGAGDLSAGSSTFQRQMAPSTSIGFYDSNADKIPAGTYSLNVSVSASGVYDYIALAMTPNSPPPSGPSNVKTWDGVTQSTGIKTYQGVALASVKSVNGIT